MRMQAEYEYSDGGRGKKLFDIPHETALITINEAARRVIPDDADLIRVVENDGRPPYDEHADPSIDTPLPGPFRMDPLTGNAFRIDGEQPPYVNITDAFGGHQTSVLKSTYEEWPECT